MISPNKPIRIVDAIAHRDGKWWTIEIPGLTAPGPDGRGTTTAVGQARSIRDVGSAARDLAAVWLDVDESELEIHIDVRLPEPVSTLWADANAQEASARAAVAEAARLRRTAVRSLLDLGVSQADAARALRLSPQRIGQLLHSVG